MLDDGQYVALGVTLDAAVAGGVSGAHGEHGAGKVTSLGVLNQVLDGLGTHERRVAVKNHRRPLEVSEGVAHAHHGVAGAQTLGLLNKLDVGIAVKDGLDLVGMVSNYNDDAVSTRLTGSMNGPPHERAVQKLMRYLGMTGLHTRSLAGGKDDRGDGHVGLPACVVSQCGSLPPQLHNSVRSPPFCYRSRPAEEVHRAFDCPHRNTYI